MKININIEVSPSELIELQDVVHEGAREVVTKLSSEGIARKILEHLEEAPNQMAYHIPADHMETGTVIQGKPPREPEAAAYIQPGDLVKCQWPDENFASRDEVYRVEEISPLDKTAMIQPMRKTLYYPLCARVEWLSKAEPEPAPPRPMRDPSTRIQTGDHVIVRPFTGYNEIFTVLAANNGRALLLGEIGEEETQELSNLLPVWPDSEGNYCFHRNDTAAEPPEE